MFLEVSTNSTYSSFEEVFLRKLSYHALTEKKILRANKNAFMNKTLGKNFQAAIQNEQVVLENETGIAIKSKAI